MWKELIEACAANDLEWVSSFYISFVSLYFTCMLYNFYYFNNLTSICMSRFIPFKAFLITKEILFEIFMINTMSFLSGQSRQH